MDGGRVMSHIPVMLDHVIDHLDLKSGDTILDGTFGGGGYTRAILDAVDCKVIGIDRDPDAISRSDIVKASYGDRFAMMSGRFGDMDKLIKAEGISGLDGVVLDLGVSSFQLDQGDRGFSFMRDGPLDMRMGDAGPSAADVVNTLDEDLIADILFQLGEERDSRRIARRIVQARAEAPFSTTLELADVIEKAMGGRRGKRTHPATKAFQALRMYVNDELGELARALSAAESVLSEGGRLVIVTFHSLEDRMVKNFLAERSGKQSGGSRFMPETMKAGPAATFEKVRKVSAPEKAEIEANARARSSKLRSAIRTGEAAWGAPVELPINLPELDEVL